MFVWGNPRASFFRNLAKVVMWGTILLRLTFGLGVDFGVNTVYLKRSSRTRPRIFKDSRAFNWAHLHHYLRGGCSVGGQFYCAQNSFWGWVLGCGGDSHPSVHLSHETWGYFRGEWNVLQTDLIKRVWDSKITSPCIVFDNNRSSLRLYEGYRLIKHGVFLLIFTKWSEFAIRKPLIAGRSIGCLKSALCVCRMPSGYVSEKFATNFWSDLRLLSTAWISQSDPTSS